MQIVGKINDRALQLTKSCHRINGNDICPDQVRRIRDGDLGRSKPYRDKTCEDESQDGDFGYTRADFPHDALPSVKDLRTISCNFQNSPSVEPLPSALPLKANFATSMAVI
jgi:hypothetical protein